MYTCRCTSLCGQVWRSKVGVHHYFWDKISHWAWSLPFQVGRVTSEPPETTCLPPVQGYKCAILYAHLFDMVLRSQVWVFMLLQKTHHGALVPVLCHVFWYWDVTLPSTDRLDHVIVSANCHFDSIQTHLGDRSLSAPVGSYLDCLHNVGRPALFSVWM